MRAVVFDWDLTLWDSWGIHLWLMGCTADALGLPRPQDEAVAREFSRPFLEHLAWFFGDDRDAALPTYLGFYHENVAEMATLYPGIAKMLGDLKDRGFLLAVFSDKRQAFGTAELAQTGVGHLLDHTSFLVDGRPYKPDPHRLQEVITALGVSAGDTVYIGDGRQDIECAHLAGAHSGAALWGSVDRETVLARKPSYRWERAKDILRDLG